MLKGKMSCDNKIIKPKTKINIYLFSLVKGIANAENRKNIKNSITELTCSLKAKKMRIRKKGNSK